GEQRVLELSPSLFSVVRISPKGDEHLLCLTNVTERALAIDVRQSDLGMESHYWFDLLAGRGWLATDGVLKLEMGPYEVLWLTPSSELERRIESSTPA
ncbi:MAG: alpha-glucosidase C-terminal domain-containing protein, partial [Thermoanaerobaculia bacterium]|nr:alpha-glucosidase C-terminal domain-containing protein [Thermoanaerobaculia bacterium]